MFCEYNGKRIYLPSLFGHPRGARFWIVSYRLYEYTDLLKAIRMNDVVKRMKWIITTVS